MVDQYIAVVDCRYQGRRFRKGQMLPAGWKPNKHFKPTEEARAFIRRERFIEMGYDPDRERGARAAQQKRNQTIRNIVDLEAEPPVESDESGNGKIDFSKLTVDSDIDRKALGEALFDQFGLKLNYVATSKADLIAAGQEAAKLAKK